MPHPGRSESSAAKNKATGGRRSGHAIVYPTRRRGRQPGFDINISIVQFSERTFNFIRPQSQSRAVVFPTDNMALSPPQCSPSSPGEHVGVKIAAEAGFNMGKRRTVAFVDPFQNAQLLVAGPREELQGCWILHASELIGYRFRISLLRGVETNAYLQCEAFGE